MANSIDLLGFVLNKRRFSNVSAWYGLLTGTASEFILSYTSTPSIGEVFSTKDFNEMMVWCVAEAPGASFGNITGVSVAIQHFSPPSQDFITMQTLSVGALTAGPAGNGTGNYSFGTMGFYTNFGDLCRVTVAGTGSSPGAGKLHVMVGLKG